MSYTGKAGLKTGSDLGCDFPGYDCVCLAKIVSLELRRFR